MTTDHSRFEEVSRRTFLRRGAQMALVLSLPSSLLAACSSDQDAFSAASTTATATTASTTAAAVASTTTSTAATTTQTAEAGIVAVAAIPDGSQLVVDFTYTASSAAGRVNNPYIAVWLEDANGDLAATIALWFKQGNGQRWLSDLRRWASVDGSDQTIDLISSASRAPGSYSVAWDGTTGDGTVVPAGDYFLAIESAREHGPYSLIREAVTLGGDTISMELTAEGELGDARIHLEA